MLVLPAARARGRRPRRSRRRRPAWRRTRVSAPLPVAPPLPSRAACTPRSRRRTSPCAATQPRCVSRIWPTFIRLGTPSGLRITSTGVPSSRNGMSSSSTIFEITPLLPWRPASLSPSEILRFFATNTRTRSLTPGGRSSPVVAAEGLHVDHHAALAVGHLQRGVANLARLLLEDRADQLLLGRQLGLALRRDLAHEQVAGADLGADADDAAVVEVAQRLLRAVRDVARDLLVAELGRAGVDLVLLDVDRGQLVVLTSRLEMMIASSKL